MPTSTPARRFPLYALLFLSGGAGLSYEILWTRMFSAVLGHEIVAVLAVVAAFFGGLAVGGWALDRPVAASASPRRWYAALELVIGGWSAVLALVFPSAASLAPALLGADGGSLRHWTVAFASPFLLLLPATVAMGGTLPAMERLCSRVSSDGRFVAGLYAANTFGAVAGVLAVTFWLSPALGFRKAQILLAGANGLCAAGALLLSEQSHGHSQSIPQKAPPAPPAWRVLPALALTGLLGIGYEVLAVRALSQIFENTVYSFAGILVIYLVGTALGAAAYQLWSPTALVEAVTRWLAGGLAVACLAGLAALSVVEKAYLAARHWLGPGVPGALTAELGAAALVLALPTVVMGMMFSHLAQAWCTAGGGLGRALSVNTIGAAAAPFLFGIVALPAVGLKAALLLVALGYLLVPVACPSRVTEWLGACLIALLASALLLLPAEVDWTPGRPGERTLAQVEGVMATVAVVRDTGGHLHLTVNNHFQMGGTSSVFSDRRQGHIPLLLHPDPRTALFLGMGTGATLAAALDHPGLQAEGVELVPEIIPLLHHFRRATGDLSSHPRVTIRVADARRFVKTSTTTYDVIVADLFHPARDGAAALYTDEHFTAIRSRLAPGGLFCQWLPLYQLDLETLRTILRTFLHVFPDGTAYLAHYSVKAPILGLVATLGERRYPAVWFDHRVRDHALRLRLRELRLQTDFNLFGGFLAGSEGLQAFAGTGALNTDDRPLVTFQAPRFVYAAARPAHERLFALLDAFRPQSSEVLRLPESADQAQSHARLRAYWTARDQFLRLGARVKDTDDVRQLLAQVEQPLLAIVRQSPEFDAAYNPLLTMAARLVNTDPRAADALLAALEAANPARPEARALRSGVRRASPARG